MGRRPRRLGRARRRRASRLASSLGVFAYELTVNAAGHNGLIAGNPGFLGKQVAAACLVAVYAFVVTWVILKGLDHFEPVRVPDSVELAGLDSELEEPDAYVFT